jgi:hypothetical protein
MPLSSALFITPQGAITWQMVCMKPYKALDELVTLHAARNILQPSHHFLISLISNTNVDKM